ncbi:MAG: 1,6-dihydroxycyclohexa-2,4-diene-carboxylate dehydrogenase [Noviherbaspirillum sp.]|nr:1,6-dihydroxycyclohexa-2,4-diene-carboxylate dehydrogenase [Noviherbaspirillum sp.]MDB5793763.1 1,6-dihydroxycyclohexa-2,4-diene-carboxylate dehydrogenase [Noviherbaspirillum sp.]
MKPLQGKTAIVTGAAQGIGRATALRLARDGAQLVLADRAAEVCAKVAAEIEQNGGRAIVIGADLETKAGVDAMVQGALDAFGRIDISVHNVGGTIWAKPFWEYADEEIQAEINRSLWPTLRSCRAVIPVMIKQGGGVIVNIGSVATRGVNRVPYSAAKGGVHAMTACLAMELAPHKIRVNAVAPGGVESADRIIPRNPNPQSDIEKVWRTEVRDQTLRDTPMGRYGEAREIAGAVAFLASDDASYMTGQVLYAAGGGIG